MKRIAFAALAALAATSASAADMAASNYTKAPAMAAVASWTGFYAGLNVGYGFNDPVATFTANDVVSNSIIGNVGTAASPVAYDVKGVLGGAQAGYNWQVSPNWLIGFEADFQGSDIKGSAASPYAVIGRPGQIEAQQNVEWFGTLRARAGLLATSKLLVYGTGGFAYGSVREDSILSNTIGFTAVAGGGGVSAVCAAAAACYTGPTTKILTGYAVGGGFEYAAWRNVSLKAEYLYVNLGSSNITSTAPATAGTTASTIGTHFSDLDFHVVRVGANYRF
ncbi:outer membrane protein [Bradyrhizobium cosmicum]|uniref:Outer-membrane immunogenic protein n=1 Tax=Bradyrhizobium cosmicum TaxID=1404864 RepID=A0AAI8MGP6_9BRAD|nr:outer membrane beta-barrel protein [Bradyrhizobium cosmicum]BAL78185.1 putative outer-membrane immunogenic protein precursor [Bradyrhizobium cosmicum]